MAGANIFIIYADASGNNVTLSPRLGTGEVEPDFDTAAQVFLLEGSGVANNVMTANVRCMSLFEHITRHLTFVQMHVSTAG